MTDAPKHALYTGPEMRGSVTLEDGRTFNVTEDWLLLDSKEDVALVAEQIGRFWEKYGHPNDVDVDDEGNRVQRPFVYIPPKKKTTKKKG